MDNAWKNLLACQMCYFLLGNSETWLFDDDDNLLLFFLHFNLVELEIGSMTNNEGMSGHMIGESFDFKILLELSLSLICMYLYWGFNNFGPLNMVVVIVIIIVFYYNYHNSSYSYFYPMTQSNSSKPKWREWFSLLRSPGNQSGKKA